MQHVPSFDIQSRIQSAPASSQQQAASIAAGNTAPAMTLRTVAIALLVDRALSA
ncbi:hypothetical protein QYH69_04490 [Paraburkholderia sp. SARCC-3016]|jgi:hypothetical protein|uniref:hypothetical protein n=1 Tax=Paraburkholderia sp. SARCC-3016 TaxID=3058611 RepID=UPI0028085618|nr:hypothetical protein [Paraburkholderia sp. SARCC-3016]MDQ7976499.1 hypothetical protein [Paraburkholderia sp. SARCC-3016]